MRGYLTEPLQPLHKKINFDCSNEMLNTYLHTQAKQDVKRKLCACFVLISEQYIIEGYYTLSSASIPRNLLPEEIIKNLPGSYINLPATLLGRLAVDNASKGRGSGAALLLDALYRSFEISKSIGSMAIIVDPIDENAISFYKKYGFLSLPDSGKMFISMYTVAALSQ